MLATRDSRRAFVLMTVVVALAIMGTLFMVILQKAASQRRQARGSQANLQALWLAQSGLERAAARLKASSDYAGETWRIPADQLGGWADATVVIKVDPAAGSDSRMVSVVADFGRDTSLPARRSLKAKIDTATAKR